MSEKFTVEIISPDRSIIKTKTSHVKIPSYEGEMGILRDHIPLITFLRPGIIEIMDDRKEVFFVEDGTVEFNDNNLLILTSTAKEIKEANKNSLKNLLNEAEKKFENNKFSDKENYLLNYKIEVLKSITQ